MTSSSFCHNNWNWKRECFLNWIIGFTALSLFNWFNLPYGCVISVAYYCLPRGSGSFSWVVCLSYCKFHSIWFRFLLKKLLFYCLVTCSCHSNKTARVCDQGFKLQFCRCFFCGPWYCAKLWLRWWLQKPWCCDCF